MVSLITEFNNHLKMRKFGLIGYPLGHSFSKKYFTEKFQTEYISDCSYENYPLKSLDGFRKFIAEDCELCGLNVTIPYKSEILGLLDITEHEAKEIGAVNVIKMRETLNLPQSTIRLVLNAEKMAIKETQRAATHFGLFGLKVDLVSRNRKPGVLSYSDIDSEKIKRTQLIVNTTPLGMFPNVDNRPDIDYKKLNSSHILFDLVYNPELTSFLRLGAEQGCRILSGIKMLHSQAEKAWQIWNDDSF